jgi:transposase
MKTIDAQDRVFLDETGVNLAMARHYARAPQGERAYAAKPVNKGKNITVLGALSLGGIQAAMTVEGSTDTAVFLTYVQRVLVPTLRPGQVVLMDNLSAHKDERIQTAIASVGAKLEYLPPYSPDLSPIEECWSKLKASLRATAARTREALDAAITHAFTLITPHDARGWFAHCGYL